MVRYYARYAAGGLVIGLAAYAITSMPSCTPQEGPAMGQPTVTTSAVKPPRRKSSCDWDRVERDGYYHTSSGKLCIDIKRSAADPESDSENLQAHINQAAQRTGVSGALLNALAGMESSFGSNAVVSASGAKGPFQFLDSTYAEKVQRYGARHGLAGESATDIWASAVMAAELVRENARWLYSVIKRQPSNTELYLAHMLGPGGAYRIINADSDDIEARKLFSGAVAENNYGAFYDGDGKPRTVGQFKQYIAGRMQKNMSEYQYKNLLAQE